jgi:hypothetical protein
MATSEPRRNPIGRYLIIAVLVVLVVSFIGVGGLSLGSLGSGGSRTVFGTYDGTNIEHFSGNYFDRQILSLNRQQQRSISAENAEAYRRSIIEQAFYRSTFRVAALSNTTHAGVVISEDRLDLEEVQNGPYRIDGAFSERVYESTSLSERRENRALLHDELLERQYNVDLTATLLGTGEREFLRAMADEERRFRVASFAYATLPDAELAQFGGQNGELFRRAKLSRILLRGGENEASEVWRRLQANEASFEELVRLYSADAADTGGDVGWRYFYDLELDFVDAVPAEQVFALGAGEYSGLLESRFGFVIYRNDAAAVAPDFADAETLQAVQAYLTQYQRGFVTDFYTGQAEQFASRTEAIGFAGAALALGAEVSETAFFPINYRNAIAPRRVEAINSTALQNAVFLDEFFEVAFSLGVDELSAPIALDDRVIVLSLLEERTGDPATASAMASFADAFATNAMFRDLQRLLLDSDRFQSFFPEAVERIRLGQQAAPTLPTHGL